MLSFSQVTRAYSSINAIVDGEQTDHTVTATVVPKENQVSKAFSLIESQSKTHFDGRIATYLYSEIKVDGQPVATVVSKKVKTTYSSFMTDNFTLDVDLIRTLASPAPFGKGAETVVDETVRKAFEIKADRINVQNNKHFDVMLEMIQNVAPPGKKLVPKLYKLHLYETGGMFVKHRDTVHAPNHHATLIVSLPCEYTGGAFVLEIGEGKTQEYDFLPRDQVHYLLFLTDMPHQVMPVESGARAVLQYDVYLEDADRDADRDADGDPEDENLDFSCDSFYEKPSVAILERDAVKERLFAEGVQLLVPAVDEFLAGHPQDTLSFLLTHQYPLNVDFDNLKAGDQTLYSILSKKYHVALGLAINSVTTNYDGGYDLDDCNTLQVMDYRCREIVDSFVQDKPMEGGSGEELSAKQLYKSHVVFGNGAGFEQVKNRNYIEYTGNEAALGEHVYASIVLAIGPLKK